MRYIVMIFIFFSPALYSFDQSHSVFDGLLKKHVQNGLVSYRGFQKDREIMKKYLAELSSVSQSEYNGFSREDRMAFLINAYNAFTIELILKNYPLKSIRKIGFLPGAAWKEKFFKLLGEDRNLDWIEHSRLRVDFGEPRIHFTIVCASIGCPHLQREAYTGKNLNAQMENAAAGFLNDSKKNYYSEKDDTLYISSIFDWFRKDFEKTGLIPFLRGYMKVKIPDNPKIRYSEYDWSLNERQ